MKFRRSLHIVILLAALSANAFAQPRSEGAHARSDTVQIKLAEDIVPRQIVAINPIRFLMFWNISYYHTFSSTLTLGVGLQIPTLENTTGYGIAAELRIYPSHKFLRGFYIAPTFSWNRLEDNSIIETDVSTSSPSSASGGVTDYSVGVLIGWQWFPSHNFAMGFGIGVDHYFLGSSGNFGVFGSYSGFVPAFRFDFGYAW